MEKFKIVKLGNIAFGTKSAYCLPTGYALHSEGKGYIAFKHDNVNREISIPYAPRGGKAALQSILDSGGFNSFEGMEWLAAL